MPDYTLYYWPAPFRGQFVRAVLAHAGADWEEGGTDETARLMHLDPADQPFPGMAPPFLQDHGDDVFLSQLPAILAYLGRVLGLLPSDAAREAVTYRLIADTNDVLDEITLNGGRQMWDADSWQAFRPRLDRWMAIFEQTGNRHGLTPEKGTMLGTRHPGLADLVTATLWFTMTDKLPPLRAVLQENAPAVAALSERTMKTPAIARMRESTDAAFGDVYCGGQIEESLRKALG